MQLAKLLLVAALAAIPLSAQNFVTNGDFAAGLTGWTQGGGYCYSPLAETWDTTGAGASLSFGCNPGGQVTPPPYPANTLEQTVTVAQGVPYEIRADLSTVKLVHTSANADGGTIWAQVNGIEVARHAFGYYAYPKVYRAQLCGRFVPTTSGPVTLKIGFERAYLGTINTPRVNIDNISLQFASGATFCIRNNRQLGSTVNFEVQGAPQAPFAVFAAAKSGGPLTIPGFAGTYLLDLATTSLIWSGTLSATGLATLPVQVPTDPYLTQAATHFQPVQLTSATTGAFGHAHWVYFFQ